MPGRWGRIQLEAPPRAPVSLQELSEREPNNEFTATYCELAERGFV